MKVLLLAFLVELVFSRAIIFDNNWNGDLVIEHHKKHHPVKSSHKNNLSTNFSTIAYTGIDCPYALRTMNPDYYCVTRTGIPQKGCRIQKTDDVYVFAYNVIISPTAILDCLRVEWFWQTEIYFF